MDSLSYLNGINPDQLEDLYSNYCLDTNSVDKSWQLFFEGFNFANENGNPFHLEPAVLDKEFKVINYIEAVRMHGHLFTKTNPVRERRKFTPTLDLENFGLSENDLDLVFHAGSIIGIGPSKLREIYDHLQYTYCHSIGVEYMYIRNPETKTWLQSKMESRRNTPSFTVSEKEHIYSSLVKAVNFEKFIHRRFVGQKRFSLEGAESIIPALDSIIEKGAGLGIEEFVIGMPHRGRLNILANILKKPYQEIFDQYIGKEYEGDYILGDVKYHLGYTNEIISESGKKVMLSMTPNPSHLETVSPVTLGVAKAKLLRKYKNDYNKLVSIIIHGDAAIGGQGVVYEVIQMAHLEGFRTGGSIHITINNQVGFTTSFLDARSSTYSTDLAKVTKCPVFHVNGDDVEALIYTIELAMEYRQEFHKDVFIDLLCYRRYGHNEADEPRFTQPKLYEAIQAHPDPKEIYANYLIAQGIRTKTVLDKEEHDFVEYLEACLTTSKERESIDFKHFFLEEEWKDFRQPEEEDFHQFVDTGVKKELLLTIAEKIAYLPPNLKFFYKVASITEERRKMVFEKDRLDWGMCELLAYGSLVNENYPVRISGQDCERGTFSHRHATFIVEGTKDRYISLKNISPNQASFHIFNSPLSEYGVLGFEYGYSMANPQGLNIWEAQFGDFANVAQVIIDQYICSANEKWGIMNGLVMYLPHGYEGQGPDHSSARIERFLTLCANNNMQLVNCTTPANLFHVLRRQMLRAFHIPLIIFTPKSLLRHPKNVASINDLVIGGFIELIDDTIEDHLKITKVLLCSGKLYFELTEKREELNIVDTAIIRLEQIYPLPINGIKLLFDKYENAKNNWIWIQEEPMNMGALNFLRNKLAHIFSKFIARPESASPAAGLYGIHQQTQEKLIDKAFGLCDCDLLDDNCGMNCKQKVRK